MKKAIHILIGLTTMVLMVLLASTQVYAFSGSGKGTYASPYIITSEAQFVSIGNELGKHYKLGRDISLGGFDQIGEFEVYPNDYTFTGSLDGAGYTISNLGSNRSDYGGIFRAAKGVEFKNIKFSNVNISDTRWTAGALVANASECIFTNCTIVDSSISAGTSAGGLVGSASDCDFISCNATNVDIDAEQSDAGGLAGSAYGVFRDCSVTNSSISARMDAGGIVGSLDGSIYNSHASASVSGRGCAGGLVGSLDHYAEYCYATGRVSGSQQIGGLIGFVNNSGSVSYCYATGNVSCSEGTVGGLIGHCNTGAKIRNSFALGNVTTSDGDAGGFIGVFVDRGTVQNCYSGGTVAPENNIVSHVSAFIGDQREATITDCYNISQRITIGHTYVDEGDYARMRKKSTYKNWDFDTIWAIEEGVQSPRLRALDSPFPPPLATPANFRQTGKTISSMTLAWDKVTGATSYEISYGSKTVSSTTNSITIKDLPEDTVYSVKLRARGTNTASPWSQNLSAATEFLPLATPIGLARSAKTDTSLTLRWLAVPGATSYQLSVNGAISTSTATSATVKNLTPNTAYTIMVKAINVNTSSAWSTAIVERTTGTALPAPTGLKADSVNGTTIQLSWNGVPNADGYEISYNNAVASTDQQSIELNGLRPSTKYYIKVRARNVSVPGNWSTEIIVQTGSAPAVLSAPSGLKKTSIATDSLTFEWHAVTGATQYIVLAGGKTYTASSPSITLNNLTPDTEYKVSVKAKNAMSESAESARIIVKTAPTDVIIIRTADDLRAMAYDLWSDYMLGNDIDLYNVPWTPIGEMRNSFWGNLDGNGFVIKNLYINRPGESAIGFFGRMSNATLRNIGFENVYVVGDSEVGAIIGYMDNCIVENCFVKGTGAIQGQYYVGGLFGRAYTYSEDQGVFGSTTAITVSGKDSVGGIVGVTDGIMTIASCYVTGEIGGEYSVGGLIGYSYAYGVPKIENSYFAGTFTSPKSNDILGPSMCEVTNSYFDSTLAGVNTPAAQARTTAQMKTQSTFVGWDFDTVWEIKQGESYPTLRWQSQGTNPGNTGNPDNPFDIGDIGNVIEEQVFPISITANEEVTLALTAEDVASLKETTFVINYGTKLQLVDFAAQTDQKDVYVGFVDDTDLEILYHENGVIALRLNKEVESGQYWSGILTSLKFKPLTSGTATVVFEQYTNN